MASKRTTSNTTIPQRPQHTCEEKQNDVILLKRRVSELESFDLSVVKERHSSPEVNALERSIDGTLQKVFGHRTPDYHLYCDAINLDIDPVSMSMDYIPSGIAARGGYNIQLDNNIQGNYTEAQNSVKKGIARAVSLLNQAVKSIEEEIEFELPISKPDMNNKSEIKQKNTNKVFVVHGHNEEVKQAVARFLEKLELVPVILHEQTNQGRTIIEKFEQHSEVGFAVVLLTPDDEGRKIGDEALSKRVRQNVLLELGYFVGKLGRDRVCAIKQSDIEMPSDYIGVIFQQYDNSDGVWKLKLARELKSAGYDVDLNNAM